MNKFIVFIIGVTLYVPTVKASEARLNKCLPLFYRSNVISKVEIERTAIVGEVEHKRFVKQILGKIVEIGREYGFEFKLYDKRAQYFIPKDQRIQLSKENTKYDEVFDIYPSKQVETTEYYRLDPKKLDVSSELTDYVISNRVWHNPRMTRQLAQAMILKARKKSEFDDNGFFGYRVMQISTLHRGMEELFGGPYHGFAIAMDKNPYMTVVNYRLGVPVVLQGRQVGTLSVDWFYNKDRPDKRYLTYDIELLPEARSEYYVSVKAFRDWIYQTEKQLDAWPTDLGKAEYLMERGR